MLVILSVGQANAVSLTISSPDADTYLKGDDVNTNFGSSFELRSKKQSATIHSAIRFDFSEMGTASITSATLRLNCFSVTAGDVNVARLTTTAWTELGATWSKYDGTNNWPVAGGDYGATEDTQTINTTGWHEWDVLTAVEWAYDNTASVVDLMIHSDGVGGTPFLRFYSRDHTDSWPQLVIEYTGPDTASVCNNIGTKDYCDFEGTILFNGSADAGTISYQDNTGTSQY